MTMFLISSDPYISSFRKIRNKTDVIKIYPEEMKNLLKLDTSVNDTNEA